MAFVKLSATQVAILSNLADAEVDTGPVFKEFVAAIKQQYGIPAEHKLRTGSTEHTDPDYATLYRKKTGERYEIDPATGRWTGAASTAAQGPTSPPAPEYRWFAVDSMDTAESLTGYITETLDFEDGFDSDDRAVMDIVEFYCGGQAMGATTAGLYIQLERGQF